jgi:hypothetical protein
MMSDPFLNYFALGILFFVVIALFHGIIAIHEAGRWRTRRRRARTGRHQHRRGYFRVSNPPRDGGRSRNLHRALEARGFVAAISPKNAKLAELHLHGRPLNRDARLTALLEHYAIVHRRSE